MSIFYAIILVKNQQNIVIKNSTYVEVSIYI